MVLLIPSWIGAPGSASLLREGMPALRALAERGRIVRLAPIPPTSVPEAAYLGLDPTVVDMAQGPLTIAALGADPPDRSVHFHLSVLSLGEALEMPTTRVPAEGQPAVAAVATRLNARNLTFVEGQDRDHGLVWEEGSIEMGTTPPSDAAGKPLDASLPEGDGEPMLRRYIDDSINLLNECEFNRRRVGEGLAPFNVLWPWGQGFRTPVPNLALRYGRPIYVESPLRRLQGLARLAGCRHGDPLALGTGTNTRLEHLAGAFERQPATVAVLPAIAEMRAFERMEEAEWLSREIDKRLLEPLEAQLRDGPCSLLLASPGPDGLALFVEHGPSLGEGLPFDERTLEERGVPTLDLAQLVAEHLAG